MRNGLAKGLRLKDYVFWALVRRIDDSEEHTASICKVIRLYVFPTRSEDMLHDRWRGEPLATASPQFGLSVTVEFLLMCRCFFECVLIIHNFRD
jgi:hypothetical protein